jgi:hypothetical protein
MKTVVTVAFLLCAVSASQPAFTAVQRKYTDDEPPHETIAPGSADNPHVLTNLVANTPVIPRGHRDLLRDYELEVASIAAQLSIDPGVISNAVGTGQITREQGEYVVGERYQVARTPVVPTGPTPSSTSDLVLIAMPFSSLQLSPLLVEYLGATPTQAKAIQKLMDRERHTTEPLMAELRTISAELGVAIQSRNNENEGTAQRLAVKQARLLKQLMSANSRLQRRINDVLDPQQRRKLDSFRRASEVTVVEGN